MWCQFQPNVRPCPTRAARGETANGPAKHRGPQPCRAAAMSARRLSRWHDHLHRSSPRRTSPVSLPQGRPFAVDDREPRGIAVASLDHEVLTEHAFEGEAEALGRPLRRHIIVIALPFEAAESGGEDELSARGRAPGWPRRSATDSGPKDVPDLDGLHWRHRCACSLPPSAQPGGPVDDGRRTMGLPAASAIQESNSPRSVCGSPAGTGTGRRSRSVP